MGGENDLPVVDPSDVKFYNMSGLTQGEDYVVDDGRVHPPDGWQGVHMKDPVTDKPVEVKTDSLGELGRGLYLFTASFFQSSQGKIWGNLHAGAGQEYGEGPIGRDYRFNEAVDLATTCRDGVQNLDELTDLINVGSQALGTVAMTMAEKYGITDNFNAANLNAITDLFKPDPNSEKSITKLRAGLEDENRLATLPRVHPSDVKFYNMSGLKEGVDYVIDDTPSGESSLPVVHPSDVKFYNMSGLEQGVDYVVGTGSDGTTLDPMHDGDLSNGEADSRSEEEAADDPDNEFYAVEEDDDWQDKPDGDVVGAPDVPYAPQPSNN